MSRSDDPIAAQVGQVLAAKARALIGRSAADLDALLDDGFIYLNARGAAFDKRSYIETFCASGRMVFMSQAFREVETTGFETFAVATLFVDDVFVSNGQSIAATYRSLSVFRSDNGCWRWTAGQTMPISTAAPSFGTRSQA